MPQRVRRRERRPKRSWATMPATGFVRAATVPRCFASSIRCRRFGSLRQAGLLRDLGREVFLLLLQALAELEADEAADLDVLADLRDQLLLELLDRLLGIFHPRLIEQA